jgi:hypothetical protein
MNASTALLWFTRKILVPMVMNDMEGAFGEKIRLSF